MSLDLSELQELQACVSDKGLRLEKRLGRGAMGVVYSAVDAEGNKVAVKFNIKPTSPDKAHYILYMEREAALHKTVKSPHVVEMYDYWDTPGYLVVKMELCDQGLDKYLESRGHTLDEAELRELMRQMMDGVRALHALGIAHRDLKPANVLLKFHGNGSKAYTAKISDLGFAKKLDDGISTSLGSPVYEAPEVANAKKTGQMYTLKCDVWSMGIALYSMVTNKFPFVYTPDLRNLRNPEPPYYELPETAEASPCLRHLLRNMLIKSPKDRYSTDEVVCHPFLMPVVEVLPQVQFNIAVPLQVVSIELGDIAFERQLQRMGRDALNLPHAVASWKPVAATWGDVARLTAPWKSQPLGDLVVVVSEGLVCWQNDPVCAAGASQLVRTKALLLSAKNGVPEPPPTRVNLLEQFSEAREEQKIVAEIAGQTGHGLQEFNTRLRLITNRTKCCKAIARAAQDAIESVKVLEVFRQETVAKYEQLCAVLLQVQRTAPESVPGLPQVAFVPNASRVVHVGDFPQKFASERVQYHQSAKAICAQAQRAFDNGAKDFTKFIVQIDDIAGKFGAIVQEHADKYQSIVDDTVVCIEAMRADARMYIEVASYISTLRRALASENPRSFVNQLQAIAHASANLRMPRSTPTTPPTPRVSSAASSGEDLESLKNQVAHLKKQLRSMEELQNVLDKAYADVKLQRDKLLAQAKERASEYKTAMEQLEQECQQLRAALESHGIPDPTQQAEESTPLDPLDD